MIIDVENNVMVIYYKKGVKKSDKKKKKYGTNTGINNNVALYAGLTSTSVLALLVLWVNKLRKKLN